METTENKNDELTPPYAHFTYLGALQLFPVLLLLIISIFGFLFVLMDTIDNYNSRFYHRNILLSISLLIIVIGLLSGMMSSFFFFYASKKRNLKTLNLGIICNAIAWTALSYVFIILTIRPNIL